MRSRSNPATWLKQCVDQLAPVITEVINLSLKCDEFSGLLKHSLVGPLLKKPNIDPELLQNYRPVSNFSLLSELIENPAYNQLQKYLLGNNLYAKCKSAYRVGPSTETAILRVHNDVICSHDKRRYVISCWSQHGDCNPPCAQ